MTDILAANAEQLFVWTLEAFLLFASATLVLSVVHWILIKFTRSRFGLLRWLGNRLVAADDLVEAQPKSKEEIYIPNAVKQYLPVYFAQVMLCLTALLVISWIPVALAIAIFSLRLIFFAFALRGQDTQQRPFDMVAGRQGRSISVVLPCFNEEGNADASVRDVLSWLDRQRLEGEVIPVNDGSVDRTQEILEQLAREDRRVRVVRHEKNRGYGAALCSGCDRASMDFIAFMDSDGQFRADDLGVLLPHLQKVDFVSGIRRQRADPLIRKVNAYLYSSLVRLSIRISCRDLNCGMKMWKRSLWPAIRPEHATGALFNAEVYLAVQEQGIPWCEVPVDHFPRRIGKQTGAHLSVILRMFGELIALKRERLKTIQQRATANQVASVFPAPVSNALSTEKQWSESVPEHIVHGAENVLALSTHKQWAESLPEQVPAG